MQTNKEVIEWLQLREKELISLHYDLIDSLNYPEVNRTIRILREYLWEFENKISIVRQNLQDTKNRKKES